MFSFASTSFKTKEEYWLDTFAWIDLARVPADLLT